jgi:hypothetical protein
LRLWRIKSLSRSDFDAILCGSQPVNVETGPGHRCGSTQKFSEMTRVVAEGYRGRHNSISRLQAFGQIATHSPYPQAFDPLGPQTSPPSAVAGRISQFHSISKWRLSVASSQSIRSLVASLYFSAPTTPDSARNSSQDCRTLSSLARSSTSTYCCVTQLRRISIT